MALDTHNAAGRWNKALLDNSARPSGALVYAPKEGGNLTDEQFDRLKAELEEGYSGAARAGRPLLLEGGLDWKAMGLTPKDMDFIEAKNRRRATSRWPSACRRCCSAFRATTPTPITRRRTAPSSGMTVLPLVARTAEGAFGLAGAGIRRGVEALVRRRPGRGAGGRARGAVGAGGGGGGSSGTRRSGRRWGMGEHRRRERGYARARFDATHEATRT